MLQMIYISPSYCITVYQAILQGKQMQENVYIQNRPGKLTWKIQTQYHFATMLTRFEGTCSPSNVNYRVSQ